MKDLKSTDSQRIFAVSSIKQEKMFWRFEVDSESGSENRLWVEIAKSSSSMIENRHLLEFQAELYKSKNAGRIGWIPAIITKANLLAFADRHLVG